MTRKYYITVWVLLAVCGINRSYGDEDILLTIAKVGDRAVIPCVNNADNQVIWFKRAVMVSYGTQVIGDKSKFMITKPVSNEWNLAIRNIVPTDEAVYTCKLDNGEVLTRRRLMVQTKPQIDEHASSPESMIVQEDDTLAIWCNVSGTPAPEVTWFRLLGQDDPPVGKGTPVAIGAVGNVLTIHNITRYGSDTYICEVTNPHGSVSRSMRITVHFPVVATVYEDEVAADLGEVAVMSCMVAGEPIYNAYWKDVNHDRIYTSWHHEVTTEKIEGLPIKILTLMIMRSTLESQDYGMYTCYAVGPDSESDARILLRRPGSRSSEDSNTFRKRISDRSHF